MKMIYIYSLSEHIRYNGKATQNPPSLVREYNITDGLTDSKLSNLSGYFRDITMRMFNESKETMVQVVKKVSQLK